MGIFYCVYDCLPGSGSYSGSSFIMISILFRDICSFGSNFFKLFIWVYCIVFIIVWAGLGSYSGSSFIIISFFFRGHLLIGSNFFSLLKFFIWVYFIVFIKIVFFIVQVRAATPAVPWWSACPPCTRPARAEFLPSYRARLATRCATTPTIAKVWECVFLLT